MCGNLKGWKGYCVVNLNWIARNVCNRIETYPLKAKKGSVFCFVGFLLVFFSLPWLVARLCVRACVNTLEMQNLCKDVIYLNFKRKMIFVFFYRWIFWFLNYISRLFVRTLFLSLELIKYWQNCVVTNLRLIQSNFLPTFLFNSSMHAMLVKLVIFWNFLPFILKRYILTVRSTTKNLLFHENFCCL